MQLNWGRNTVFKIRKQKGFAAAQQKRTTTPPKFKAQPCKIESVYVPVNPIWIGIRVQSQNLT